MEQLRLRFELSMLLLLSVASVTFAAAEGNPLAALTAPIAVFAWLAVDRTGRKGVGPAISLLLGVIALSAAIAEFLFSDIEARLLAPAHLLFYLSWIFLLQNKITRRYWMLLGLSVLQIAIAALLTNSAWFGLALVAYAAIALWTLGLFTIHRAVQRVAGESQDDNPASRQKPAAAPLASPPATLPTSSQVTSAAPYDVNERLLGWRFNGGAATTVLISLTIAAVFFVLIPRMWASRFQFFDNSPLAGSRPLTGFTEEITLGDMGEILESNDLVMEIELFEEATKEPIPGDRYDAELGGPEPLIRGQVLENYENGRWIRHRRYVWSSADLTPQENNVLEQRIRLEPIGTPILFGAGRVLTCVPEESWQEIQRESNSDTFRRGQDANITQQFDYIAYSSRDEPPQRRIRRNYTRRCLVYSRETLGPVADFADKVLQPEGAPPPQTDRQKAALLEAALRDSGEFTYSLDLSIQDPSLDPLVDFLVNRKQGHCEYFASALVIMLRSQDIPARMVSGFKGGQYNSGTGRYEVRQLHAHAWVEALIDGQWQPLDPTPAGRDVSVASQVEQKTTFAGIAEQWASVWDRGVRLSQSDQDRLVYAPLRDGLRTTWESLRDLRGTAGRLAQFARRLVSSPQEWFSWKGGLAAAVLALIAFGMNALIRKIIALARFTGDASQDGAAPPQIPFYERFCRLSARAGLERAAVETQQEFALGIRRKLTSRLENPGRPAVLPTRLTDVFYAVRFGGKSLSREDQADVDRMLGDYEQTITELRSRKPR